MRLAPRFGVSARALGSGYRLEFDGATYTHESDPVLAFASVQPTTLRFRLVPKDPKPRCRRRRFNGPTRKQRAARFVAVPEGSRGGMTLVGSSGARMRRILGFDTPEGRRT